MTDNINKLNTKNWQHRLGSVGEVVTDADDVSQCYEVIFKTQIGSVPFNPNLGWDILAYLGRPINEVEGKMRTDLLSALNLQEPRAYAQAVKFSYDDGDNGHLSAEVEFVMKDSGLLRSEVYTL